MRFEVTVLGSSSAVADNRKHHSAHVLNAREQFYLIDCGEATQIQLRRYGVNLLKINHIFISHLHGDHVFGLPGMISTLGFMGKRTPLHIYAPAPITKYVEYHKELFESELAYEIVVHEVNNTEHQLIYENKVLEVWSIPLRHSVATSGYLFREKVPPRNVRKECIERYGLTPQEIVAIKAGSPLRLESGEVVDNEQLTYLPYKPRSYAYCSDTNASGRVAEIVSGVDLLYHEATFAEDQHTMARKTGHSTARQAAKIAAQAGVGRLLIGHHSSRYKTSDVLLAEAREIFPDTLDAVEGEVYKIDLIQTKL